jgi:predicted RNase H-like HicB family nuclease
MIEEIDLDNLTEEQLMAVRRYALVIEWSDEDQVFLATAPDLPGVRTHGSSRAEAAKMGEEVIALWLHGQQDLPAARFTAMPYRVRPDADAPLAERRTA